MNLLEFVSQLTPPWIATVDANPNLVLKLLKQYSDETTRIFLLDGEKMRSFENLYDEFHLKFNFPDYFGRNSSAIIDCFRDIAAASFSPVVIVIDKFDAFLHEEDNDSVDVVQQYLGLLWYIAERFNQPIEGGGWDRPAVPFHVVLLQRTPIPLCADDHPIPRLEVE